MLLWDYGTQGIACFDAVLWTEALKWTLLCFDSPSAASNSTRLYCVLSWRMEQLKSCSHAILDCRTLGPTMFRNAMLLRQVPCLLTVPYFEWLDQGLHKTTLYLEDRLKSEVQRLAALPE